MNLKRLISCVYERRSIWDQKNCNYNNKVVVKQQWIEIAEEMKCSAEVCRQKWRSLRDVFRRELRKYQARLENSNILDKAEPRWYYFKELQFLMDQMVGFDNMIPDLIATDTSEEQFESYYMKNPVDSTAIKDEPDPIGQEDQHSLLETSNEKNFFTEINEETLEEEQEINKAVTSVTDRPRLRRPLSSQSSGVPLRDGRKRPRLEGSREDDSDYHFLMSLLPYLQAIPYERKILVRTKIQNIFCEEMNGK